MEKEGVCNEEGVVGFVFCMSVLGMNSVVMISYAIIVFGWVFAFVLIYLVIWGIYGTIKMMSGL